MKKWMLKMAALALTLVLSFGIVAQEPVRAADGAGFVFSQYAGENFVLRFDGTTLVLENLPDTAPFQSVLLYIVNLNGTKVKEELLTRDGNGRAVYALKGMSDGEYYVELFTANGGVSYGSYCIGDDLHIRLVNGSVTLQPAATLSQNKQAQANKRQDMQALAYYTTASRMVQSTDAAIVRLSESLTAGLTDDYAKALAVHDWVATNIWYDNDAVKAGKPPAADALTTLKTRTAVCEGYSNLYVALLRAADIPARTVTGYGMTASLTGGWTSERMKEENHAWSEVYVDGRWMFVDVTWNSANSIENGKKVKSGGVYNYRYFDTTVEAYSIDHRLVDYGERYVPAVSAPTGWAAGSVDTAIGTGIVPRAWQTRFTQAATRAEFSALAVALYGHLTGKSITTTATFPDTNDMNMLRMVALGVVTGSGNGSANPNGKLTREQAATMLARLASALGKPLPKAEATFADTGNVAHWALEAVGQVQAAGIMSGSTINTFNPQADYTREQCIVTILRLYTYCMGD